MKIASDPERRIALDGVGLVERPLEVTPEQTGWEAPTARAYRYREGQVVHGESAGDEMVMLLLRGDIALGLDGEKHRCRRDDPWAEGPVVLYLPPGRAYRADVRADSLVLYCRAPVGGTRPTRVLEPDDGEAVGADVAERLRIREHRVAAGAWARIPVRDAHAVAYHHFAVPGGWALCPSRRDGGPPEGATVLVDGDAVVGPGEELEVVVAPDGDLLVVVVGAD